MSRVALAKIPALTFYKDSVTLSRRTRPIPQLTCVGKPCKSYQPDVVRCESLGGEGTDIDWKVNVCVVTDDPRRPTNNEFSAKQIFPLVRRVFCLEWPLDDECLKPSALRFGRVEVSCEGWSKPGDPYVLKGS